MRAPDKTYRITPIFIGITFLSGATHCGPAPEDASSVDTAFDALATEPLDPPRLLDGNRGTGGDWFFAKNEDGFAGHAVLMWHRTDHDITHRIQVATDIGFTDIWVDVEGIEEPDWGHPSISLDTHALVAGKYFFRVAPVDTTHTQGDWSATGKIEIADDQEPPTVQMLAPLNGDTVAKGEELTIQLQVSDDTLLSRARIFVDGEYIAAMGLKTENYKVSPSLGHARTVSFQYQLPSTGKAGATQIEVLVEDVFHQRDTATAVVETYKNRGR